MNRQLLIEQLLSPQLKTGNNLPTCTVGDTIDVHYKIVEGDKERVQVFQGVLLAGASGPAYNIYSYPQGPFDPPYSTLGIWANGIESTRELPGYSSVFTVPAPGAFAALAFAGLASHRRRRN